MADEVRRSGRANKGHHTKNADALDEPIPKAKPKQKPEKKPSDKPHPTRSQSVQSGGDEEEEEDAVIRCVCGDQRDIRGRQMICCDTCEAWQHNRCLNLPEGSYWDNKNYYCERCKPEDHVELLAAMARGEKPWNRKKGQRPPKSRPSDVKAEPFQEKSNQPTPPPAQPPTHAAEPAPAQAEPQPPSEPAPAAAPVTEMISGSEHAPDDEVEAKPIVKEATESQPLSPTGEKRRHESIAEKDSVSKKRRKSSAPQNNKAAAQHDKAASQKDKAALQNDKAASQGAVPSDIDALPAKQKAFAGKLKDSLVQLINAAVESRGYVIQDGETAESLAISFALKIEHAAFLRHGEPAANEAPYVLQLRSILFNVKKNTILVDRLLSGSLTPEDLASMAPEEMASEEKQREYAAMREANEKQMVLTEESGPRLRKTHKGEELVGGDDMPVNDDYNPLPPRDRESISEEKLQEPPSPSREAQTAVELPEDVGGRAPIAVDTSSTPTDGVRRPSTTFDINSVFDKVRSPQNDQHVFLPRRQSSIRVSEKPSQGPGVDADVDRLLKDEEGDVAMSGYQSDPTIVWQGSISMQQWEPFEAVARFVAGGDFGQVIPWNSLLSSTLPIQGRIDSLKGDDYIRGLAQTGSHDVSVLALSPVSAEGRAVMDNVYGYFHPRDRWGVVPVDKLSNDSDAMRDLYVIPIPPGGSNLPPFLDMLEYCTIETPRKERMMLLALIAKLPETKPQLPPAQPMEGYPAQPGAQAAPQVPPTNGPTNGPSQSPAPNPHGPQYSPVSAAFPPAHNFGNHYAPPQHNGHTPHAPMASFQPPASNQKVVEILGPFIDTPVITQLLQSPLGASMSELQMSNLRHILEQIPEARTDLAVLAQHLSQKEAANGQG